MNKLIDLFALLQKGNAVANVKAWEKGRVTVTILAPVLFALMDLSRDYGLTIPLSHDQVVTLAMLIVVGVNFFVSVATHKEIGIGKRVAGEPDATAGSDSSDPEAAGNGGDPEVREGSDSSGAVSGSDPRSESPKGSAGQQKQGDHFHYL